MKGIFAGGLLSALLVGIAGPAASATYDIDPVHSAVTFRVTHMMISKVPGKFSKFSGWFDYDPKNFKVWKASATIEAASIDTGIEKRDNHLRSADFLDVATFPTIEFRSTGVVEKKDGSYQLKGDLTLRGLTRPVVLDLEPGGLMKDPRAGMRAAFSASTKINRMDYGVKWNQLLEAGGVLVGETVWITIDVEGIQRK